MTDRSMRRAVDMSLLFTALALIAGGIIASVGLARDSLWLDETYTWLFVRSTWPDLLTSTRIVAVHPPLYYILVKALVGSGPLTEVALRFPSVIFHLIGITGAASIGAILGGRTGRVAAAWMWALHPMAIWYAREARPYALAAALAAITLACYLRAERQGSPWTWALGGVSMAAGLVTHYFFFVFVGTLVLASLAIFRERPRFFRSWTLLTLAALVPLAVWLAWLFQQGQPSFGIAWIPRPSAADLALTLWNMVSGYGGNLDPGTTLWGIVLLSLAAVGLTCGDERHAARRYAIAGIALPLLSVWLVSLRRPVFVDRYFLILLPWVAALVALGMLALQRIVIAGRSRRWSWAAVAAMILGLAVATQVLTAAKYRKENWRSLVDALQEAGASSRDLVLSEPEISLPLVYYGALPSIASGNRLVPVCDHHCWWILRQPYTVTHAFTQSVNDPDRPWLPEIPSGCRRAMVWESPTGIRAWELACP
jgi:mannosyltransferase